MLEHPDVGEVAVVGVPCPSTASRSPASCAPAAAAGGCRRIEGVHPRAAVPAKDAQAWLWVDQWPLTGSGKIQKFKLAEQFAAGEHPAAQRRRASGSVGDGRDPCGRIASGMSNTERLISIRCPCRNGHKLAGGMHDNSRDVCAQRRRAHRRRARCASGCPHQPIPRRDAAFGGRRAPGEIRDLSAGGARIEGERVPRSARR